MLTGTDLAREARSFLVGLFKLVEPSTSPPSNVLVVSFGSVQSPGSTPLPPNSEYLFMAVLNIGQRVGPLVAKWFAADGSPTTIDGEPVFSVVDPAIAEIRDFPDGKYAVALTGGSTIVNCDGDADRSGNVRTLHLEGLLISNDPASEAQTGELELGAVSDVPAP